MRKISALIFALLILFSLCSCRKTNGDMSDNGSEMIFTSELEVLDTSVESDTFENVISSEAQTSSTVKQSSQPAVESQVSQPVDISVHGIESNAESAESKVIDFIPKRYPTFNSDETYISLSNIILYNGTNYAISYGESNGAPCYALITFDENYEYKSCVLVFDIEKDSWIYFTIYNDRIYYFYSFVNDARDDYVLLDSIEMYSMNLLGADKRLEKKIDILYTHIQEIQTISNSEYFIFGVDNLLSGTYEYYRYNVITKEFVKINRPHSHKGNVLINNQIFVLHDSNVWYVYDIDGNNKKLFFDARYLTADFLFVYVDEKGFIIKASDTGNKYFLDFSGNISPL